ncbi:MAG: substrate-binding domain-containing protein [Spirochaetota bacterium]
MRPDTSTQRFIEELTRSIRERGLQGHERIEGQDELGKKFGVSYTVVRKGLKKLIEQKLIYRIKGKGTFVAPREHLGIKNYIVIIPNINAGGIIPDLWQSIIVLLKGDIIAHGFLPIVFSSAGDFSEIRKMCYEDQIRAAVFFGIDPAKPAVRDAEIFLKKRHIPLTYLEQRGKNTESTVTFDDEAAGAQCAMHLASIGKKRIAIIADKKTGAFGRRIHGFLSEAERHAVNATLVMSSPPDVITREQCRAFDGIAFLYEGLAYSTLALLKGYGVRIPDDLAVITISGSPLTARTDPPLSSSTVPVEEMAAGLTERIFALLEGKPPLSLLRVTPILIPRESTTGKAP